MSAVAAAVKELSPMFAGRLIQPGDAPYHDARQLHNGMIDKKPALIAQCRGTADISDAIKLAKSLGLEIAVRGGGHNVGGRAAVEGGLMIDLSLMKGVHVDPLHKIAWADGGTVWKEFNRETQHYGLATTGGVISSTGVAGLTLGGGFGWLMPKFGMSLDNLRAVKLVLADGSVVRASHDDHADLFWAVRGGGSNFGVAASFEFNLHDVGPMVVGGLVAHPIDRARDVLRFFRDHTQTLPDDVFMVAALITAPDGNKAVGLAAVHSGTVAAGEKALAPVKAFGSPVMDVMGPMPYAASNMMLDESFPRGSRCYWKSNFLATLTDGAIDTLVDQFMGNPSPLCGIVVEYFHGAATRVPVDATAYALRHTGYNVLINSQWLDKSDDAKGTSWCRTAYQSLQPFVSAHRYLNYFVEDDMTDAGLSSAYGPNLPRLRKIKRQYDPDNMFHLNANITPA